MPDSVTDNRFPPTRDTLVEAITSPDPGKRSSALEVLVRGYWRPVYSYLRLQWHLLPADAEDLTQDFFLRLLEREFLAGYDQQRARFRTYLRVCLDGFAANHRKAAGRLKRGGATPILSLDFRDAEGELRTHDVPDPSDPEVHFRRAWVRALFTEAVVQLQREFREAGKERSLAVFERYDLADRPAGGLTYAQVARGLGLSSTQVNNYLAAARRRFRQIVLERLRELCVSEAEFRAEASELFGGG